MARSGGDSKRFSPYYEACLSPLVELPLGDREACSFPPGSLGAVLIGYVMVSNRGRKRRREPDRVRSPSPRAPSQRMSLRSMSPRPRMPWPRQIASQGFATGQKLAFSGSCSRWPGSFQPRSQLLLTCGLASDRGPCRHSSAPLNLPILLLPLGFCRASLRPCCLAWWEARTSPASRPTSGKAWPSLGAGPCMSASLESPGLVAADPFACGHHAMLFLR